MRTLPSISIVVLSYNQAEFLPQALDSILSQNYPSVEVFVVDGQSTDKTLGILKSYGGKIQWVSEPDKGQADALNKGFQKTKAEILGWLNSDDCYEPGALHVAGNFFAEHPEIMWAFGICSITNEKGEEIRRLVTRYKTNKLRRYSYQSLLEENFISQMGVFIRRQALEQVGGANPHLHYAMDYDLWLRLGKSFPPGFVDKKIGRFRMHKSSKSITGFKKQFDEDFRVACQYAEGKRYSLFMHGFNNLKILTVYQILALWRRIKNP